MSALVTRLAPTPSGYLHVGNAVNLVLTSWLARGAGGRLLLRIDDFDKGRARREYLEDVFDTLTWLGIEADAGPTGPDDFHAQWSMSTRTPRFRAVLDSLRARHPNRVFVCRCSRRELSTAHRCAQGCADARHPLLPGESLVRLRVDEGVTAPVGGTHRPVPPGDHVLWRRDDLPAYQLGSVVADLDLGVTAVVRGVDLLDSSAVQVHVAGLLDEPAYAAADFRHHALVPAADGGKLSKSAGAQAHPMLRTPSLRSWVRARAAELGEPVGIRRPRGEPDEP